MIAFYRRSITCSSWVGLAVIVCIAGCEQPADVTTIRASTEKIRDERHDLVLTHKLGFVLTESENRHVFEFQNETGHPLIAKRFLVSCRCGSATMNKQLISPDETVAITIQFKAASRSVDFLLATTCELIFSDTEEPCNLLLNLEANVRKPLTVELASMHLHDIERQRDFADAEFRVDAYTPFNQKLAIESQQDWLAGSVERLEEQTGAEASWRCNLQVIESLPPGRHHGVATISGGGVVEEIEVTYDVEPVVSLMPAFIFSVIQAGEPATAELVIHSNDPTLLIHETEFVTSSSIPERLQAEVVDEEGERMLRVSCVDCSGATRGAVYLQVAGRDITTTIPVTFIAEP